MSFFLLYEFLQRHEEDLFLMERSIVLDAFGFEQLLLLNF